MLKKESKPVILLQLIACTKNFKTSLLSTWNRVLLYKLNGSHLVKKFSGFYETRMFLTAFTIACHLPPILSQINPVHAPPKPTPEDPTYFYSPTYAWISQVISFPHVSPPKPGMQLSSIVLHAQPIQFF
jgi:hypothetical protein